MKKKHIHNFKDYKEIEVPNGNGKYLIKSHSTLNPYEYEIEHGLTNSSIKIMTSLCLILYCTTCGNVKINKLKS